MICALAGECQIVGLCIRARLHSPQKASIFLQCAKALYQSMTSIMPRTMMKSGFLSLSNLVNFKSTGFVSAQDFSRVESLQKEKGLQPLRVESLRLHAPCRITATPKWSITCASGLPANELYCELPLHFRNTWTIRRAFPTHDSGFIKLVRGLLRPRASCWAFVCEPEDKLALFLSSACFCAATDKLS